MRRRVSRRRSEGRVVGKRKIRFAKKKEEKKDASAQIAFPASSSSFDKMTVQSNAHSCRDVLPTIFILLQNEPPLISFSFARNVIEALSADSEHSAHPIAL